MSKTLTLDEMAEQFKTHWRGALQKLADQLGVEKKVLMGWDFDPIEEEDGSTFLFATRPDDGKRWVYQKETGWKDVVS